MYSILERCLDWHAANGPAVIAPPSVQVLPMVNAPSGLVMLAFTDRGPDVLPAAAQTLVQALRANGWTVHA